MDGQVRRWRCTGCNRVMELPANKYPGGPHQRLVLKTELGEKWRYCGAYEEVSIDTPLNLPGEERADA